MLLFASSAATIALIVLLTIPAIVHQFPQHKTRNASSEIYQDADGQSTPKAVEACTAKTPKVSMLLLSVTGLGLSITLAVKSTLSGTNNDLFLNNWLSVGGWVRSQDLGYSVFLLSYTRSPCYELETRHRTDDKHLGSSHRASYMHCFQPQHKGLV